MESTISQILTSANQTLPMDANTLQVARILKVVTDVLVRGDIIWIQIKELVKVIDWRCLKPGFYLVVTVFNMSRWLTKWKLVLTVKNRLTQFEFNFKSAHSAYLIDDSAYSDLDECTSHENSCSYKAGCQNTIGSYSCSCLPGYYLDADGKTCQGSIDIDGYSKWNYIPSTKSPDDMQHIHQAK